MSQPLVRRFSVLPRQAKHLYLLDLLRGIGSLAVVVWHYEHFFSAGSPVSLATMPFYGALSLFYTQGWRAVQVFFILSGFIFFYQYAESIRTKAVGPREFFILRFSRLYPLHFATLIFVALGQFASHAVDGTSIVYHCNDFKYFILNLFFLTDWVPQNLTCYSFNGPIWSLSVKIFLYAIFFCFALAIPKRWLWEATFFVIIIGVAMLKFDGFHLFGEPVFCFFSGGLAYLLWNRMHVRAWRRSIVISGAVVLFALSSMYAYFINAGHIMLGVVIYPVLIFILASAQDIRNDLGKNIRVIGDISYSTYLLHFPLQLSIMLLIKMGLLQIDFSLRSTWIGFFALLILVSIPAHYFFERPAQRLIRRALERERSTPGLSRLDTITMQADA
jgi:peptidoglycan/LPS O-acetylase OafA/YrhL